MKIKALEFYNNGMMTEGFAFGGSAKPEEIDTSKTYASSLQNYLIDTGKEVILIDTGLPKETPDFKRDPDAKLYIGEKVASFPEALASLGYKPEDIDKILITHKHPDHTGELRMFPDAKIYITETDAKDLALNKSNIVPLKFNDGPYKNFPASQKISENLVMVPAYGHTKGSALAILEYNGLYYMFHGDVTYTDAALKADQLSVVFEDATLARETLELVREFIKNNKTVYLSTHTPEALHHLENNEVMTL